MLTLLLAIHEIFASNANKFPDRECVIETKSRQRPQRTFTYRQINESSNQLARYFLENGCEVGDVVTIYAYRGFVKLCVLFTRRHLLTVFQGGPCCSIYGSSQGWCNRQRP